MNPILYARGTKTFTGRGLGVLYDTVSATVTEERNGKFELELEYPVGSALSESLLIGNLIAVKAGLDDRPNQAFEIYKVDKDLSGIITINAQHVTYKASQVFYSFYERDESDTVETSLGKILDVNYDGCITANCPFTGSSDITTTTEEGWIQHSANGLHSLKSMLWPESSGETESAGYDDKDMLFNLLYTFGIQEADIVPDNYNIGINNPKTWGGLVFRYGVNIQNFSSDLDASDTINGIVGYVTYYSDYHYQFKAATNRITAIGSETQKIANYEAVDFSGDFDDPSSATRAQIQAKVDEYIVEKNYTGVPVANIQIDYVDGTGLEKACLLDKVKVIIPGLDIDIEETIVKVEFDALRERINKLELGRLKTYVIGG